MNKNLITFFSIIGLLIYTGQSFPQGNWEQVLPPAPACPTSNQLVSLYFTDANTGWSVGENGTILKTTDAGDSWDIVEIPWLTYLLDVYFVSESVGYIVGQDGLILKSNDSGESWTKQDILFTNNMHRVRFLDENNGWIIGEKGLILHTNDGGAEWQQQVSNVREKLNGISFIGNDSLCIVGDNFTILKSSDKGQTWRPITFVPGESDLNSRYHFNDVCFLNETQGWIGGEKNNPNGTFFDSGGCILRSTDGGQSWTENKKPYTQCHSYQGAASGLFLPGIQQIFFLDEQRGFFLTQPEGIVNNIPYFTEDGGKNWYCEMYGFVEWNNQLGRLFYLSENRVINTGYRGEFRVSDNVDQAWHFTNAAQRGFIKLLIGNHGILVGIRNSEGENIRRYYTTYSRSEDLGKNWIDFTPQYYDSTGNPTEPSLQNLLFISITDDREILRGFDYNQTDNTAFIYESKDYGFNWHQLRQIECSTPIFPYPDFFETAIMAPHFLTPDTLIGYFLDKEEVSQGNYHTVFRFNCSFDGGQTINSYSFSDIWNDIGFISASYFFNVHEGFLVGSKGNIIKTSDTGQSWRAINSGVVEHLHDIEFVNESVGFIAGNFGRILKTKDRGDSWYKTNSGTQENIHAIAFKNELEGWAGTKTGVRYTNDGGENWQGVPLRYHQGLVTNIEFDKYGNGFAFSTISPTQYGFFNSFGRPEGYSFLLSWNSEGLGVEKEYGNKIIPKTIALKQNYPNPFNPSTSINYSLPGSGMHNVSLKIYNLLGKEVKTLVNEVQAAGIHCISWNGKNNNGQAVTSGIYLYQLKAGNFVRTRKMSLLR